MFTNKKMSDLSTPILYIFKCTFPQMLCQWTADACGFKIDVIPMDGPTLKSEPYLKMHFNQKAPALLTQSGVIVESATIARYMARSTGKLYGADPFEHAQVDQWLDYFVQDLLPLNPLFA